jgi:hypothetical protein
MRYGLRRIPIPMLFALAVAVGVAVTLIIQITVVPPPPAIVLPIETGATDVASGTAIHTISLSVPADAYAIYGTLGGMGRLKLETDITGWYYLQNDWLVAVVRRSPGNATYSLTGGGRVVIREINSTHAVVFYDRNYVTVVAQKVRVGTTGWYIYHPVATSYPTEVRNTIVNILTSLGYSFTYVFQPTPDYVKFDPNIRRFTVYFDTVSTNGQVRIRDYSRSNSTKFTLIPADSAVTVNAILQIDLNNYVLFPIWLLLYYQPSSDVDVTLTITPVP